jgi:predicted XRE-type DNA-binding protein
MKATVQRITSWKVSQAQAARRLEIPQPQLKGLLRGRIDEFGLDMLAKLAVRSDIPMRLHITMPV